MNPNFSLPLDFRESQAYRQLEELMTTHGISRSQAPVWADSIYLTIFREFGLKRMDGGSPGRLPLADVPLFMSQLGQLGATVSDKAITAAELLSFLKEPARLIQEDEGDLVCPRFANVNPGRINPTGRSMHQRGGDVKKFYHDLDKANQKMAQLTFSINSELYKTPDGEPMESEVIRRVNMVICGLDSALFKPDRPKWGFTETLIHNAWRVLEKYAGQDMDELDRLILCIAKNRDHVYLSNMTTDKLLPQLAEVVKRLQPE